MCFVCLYQKQVETVIQVLKSAIFFSFQALVKLKKEWNAATIAELSIFTDSNLVNSENTALLKKVAHTKTKISVLHQMLYLDFKSEICPKNEEHSKIISWISKIMIVNPFHAIGLFPYPLKTSPETNGIKWFK